LANVHNSEQIRLSNEDERFNLTESTNHFNAIIICLRGNKGIGTLLNSLPIRFEIKPNKGRIFINVENKRTIAFFFVLCFTLRKAFQTYFSTKAFLPWRINLFVNLANQNDR